MSVLQSSDANDPLDSWHEPVNKGIIGYAIPGLLIVLLGVGGFSWWAVSAPIASAAVARGVLVATGQNKVVQHLEGGIIKKILVTEGQKVEPGQTLIELSGTQARAQSNRLQQRYFSLRAMAERLEAERLGKSELSFSNPLVGATSDPQLKQILTEQSNEFEHRRTAIDEERGVIEKRILAIKEEIEGLKALKKSNAEQAALIAEELEGAKKIYEKGLMRKSRYLSIKRSALSLGGENANFAAKIAQAKQRISEAETQISQMESKYKETSVTRLTEVKREIDDLHERKVAALDVVNRQNVVAPARGVILKMHVHTPGAVIGPGKPILEMLPTDERLLIEAHVRPEDIDAVYKGLEAHVRLVALNQRSTPLVKGEVIYVSADAMARQPGQDVHYLARIKLDGKAFEGRKDVKLASGMPVEVYIQTGERTFLDYLIDPITGSFQRAFKEQ